MIKIDVPNLDCITTDPGELYELSRNLSRLANYAGIKSRAMSNRKRGLITIAQLDEAACEGIYASLPPEWKW
jgi:hypothetical protein